MQSEVTQLKRSRNLILDIYLPGIVAILTAVLLVLAIRAGYVSLQ